MTRIEASRWSWILAGVALVVAVLLLIPTMVFMHVGAGFSSGALFVPLLTNAIIGLVLVLAAALVVGQGVLERRPGLIVRSPGVLIGCFFLSYLVIAGVIGYAWGRLLSVAIVHVGELFPSIRLLQWAFAMTRWLPIAVSFWLALRLTLLLCRMPTNAMPPSLDMSHRRHASTIFATIFLASCATVMQALVQWQSELSGNGWVPVAATGSALLFTLAAWLGAWLGLKYQRGERVRPGLLLLAALGTWLAPALLLVVLAVIALLLVLGSSNASTALLVSGGVLALILLLSSPFFLAWWLTRLIWRRAPSGLSSPSATVEK